MKLIEFNVVSKTYEGRVAVRDVSLSVTQGERLVIVGHSGCGKTTMLRLLAGFVAPDTGSITIDHTVVAAEGRNLKEPEERNLGMVFQDLALWPHLTVMGNLEFGLKAKGVPKMERATRIREMLALVQMEPYVAASPVELSGGQQQRVALARALALRPRVLLMDEPLSNLDFELNGQMRQEILKLHQALGFTLLYVTHNPDEAFEIGTRLVVMRHGTIERMGVVKRSESILRPCPGIKEGETMRVIHAVGVVALVGVSVVCGVSRGVRAEDAKQADAKACTFDADHVGEAPSGFVFGRTGSGRVGRWIVQADKDAPSSPNILAQVDADQTDYRFPVAVASEPILRDMRLSVKCKPVSGEVDQACGLVFRYQDENNYYITRANALEGNIRLYHVVKGDRQQFAGWNGPVASGAWHELVVEAQGSQFSVYWDGQEIINAQDQTFLSPGHVGIWTKADSVTYFDDLHVEPLGP
ncbi:MAG: ABC transporter ATP-binding protein [Candidatus Omnitrophica bacterium]|nr:ABC transporter ATP-binding protein [Candidatus Omnitrophota bacterium]